MTETRRNGTNDKVQGEKYHLDAWTDNNNIKYLRL